MKSKTKYSLENLPIFYGDVIAEFSQQALACKFVQYFNIEGSDL